MGVYKSLELTEEQLRMFNQYIPYTVRFNRRNYGDEDTLQSMLMTLARCVINWQDGHDAKFMTYLHQSLINRRTRLTSAYKASKSKQVPQKLFSEYEWESSKHQGYFDILENALLVVDEPIDAMADASAIISQLKQRLRYSDWLLLRQRYIDGLTFQEIADKDGCSRQWAMKMVESALSRAREIVNRVVR